MDLLEDARLRKPEIDVLDEAHGRRSDPSPLPRRPPRAASAAAKARGAASRGSLWAGGRSRRPDEPGAGGRRPGDRGRAAEPARARRRFRAPLRLPRSAP